MTKYFLGNITSRDENGYVSTKTVCVTANTFEDAWDKLDALRCGKKKETGVYELETLRGPINLKKEVIL